MKKTFILLIVMFVTLSLSAQNQQKAIAKFSALEHNFGDFPESDPIQKYSFEVENTGNYPLVIHKVMTSCGCTVASFTKKPIMPKMKGSVEVQYSGKNRAPGSFVKALKVYTNANKQPQTLIIRGCMK